MARKVRHSVLESRSARLRLSIRRRPYSGPSLARGIMLMYRRNKSNGAWIVKASDGHGAYWTRVIALADDFEESNGKTVLTFYEVQDIAKKIARGEDGSTDSAPLSLDAALKAYRNDLEARQANPYNADWPRVHLTSVLLSKPVALLGADELSKWRNGLLSKMAPSTVNRLCRCLAAALELAAQHHPAHIQNKQAWVIGLAALPDAVEARNIILPDNVVLAFVAEAYRLDYQLGLLVDVLAQTGARPSQPVRLRVEDLKDAHPAKPTLRMPKSGKGGTKNRAERKLERFSVAITPALARRLRAAAKGRADDAPLLLQSDGTPWPSSPSQTCHRLIDRIVKAIGFDPAEVTLYALRHSSIVRRLLQNMPVRLVAATHDTSTKMIEKHYSVHIAEHADDHARIGLLQDALPSGDNIVAMAG